MKRVALALLTLGGVAHADEKLVPTAVAVSSTVDNVNIKPDQLIDGKMTTAWNSVTGETGAWVAVRVPVKAHVTAIKLTAGFTAIDKKLGDLFTENIRIKHVKVARYGTWLGELDLDTNNRELQTLKIDADGGDFKVFITDTLPGSKKNWKEIAVSELEVWGTPAPVDPAAKKPAPIVVKVGDLDADAMLTKAECKRALGPAENPIIDEQQIFVTDALTLCRRDMQAKGDTSSTITIGLADRRTKKLIQALEPIEVNNGASKRYGDENMGGMVQEDGAVTIELRPLSTTERVIIVQTVTEIGGPMLSGKDDRAQWYRASVKGLTKIHEVSSSENGGEESTDDRCALAPFTVGASLPKQLVYDCVHTTTDWHNDDESKRGSFDKERKDRYKWNGSEYVKL